MKTFHLSLIVLVFFFFSACGDQKDASIEIWKKEIADTEAAFEAMAAERGIRDAFLAFADDGAVLMRNNKIFKVHQDADSVFSTNSSNVKLSWSPDFIDVSSAGDLGYTYGGYTVSIIDSTGNEVNTSSGIFHTVWKRQKDGSWKYVWD